MKKNPTSFFISNGSLRSANTAPNTGEGGRVVKLLFRSSFVSGFPQNKIFNRMKTLLHLFARICFDSLIKFPMDRQNDDGAASVLLAHFPQRVAPAQTTAPDTGEGGRVVKLRPRSSFVSGFSLEQILNRMKTLLHLPKRICFDFPIKSFMDQQHDEGATLGSPLLIFPSGSLRPKRSPRHGCGWQGGKASIRSSSCLRASSERIIEIKKLPQFSFVSIPQRVDNRMKELPQLFFVLLPSESML